MILSCFRRPAAGAVHLWLVASLMLVGGLMGEEGSLSREAMRVLKRNCLSCHNAQKSKGELSLATHEDLLKGGASGAVVISGSPEKSLLIESLASDADPHMPPKKQLPPDQIELLTKWLQEGAAWDAAALAGPSSEPREVQLAPLPGTYHPIFALAVSPDGSRLAAGFGNQVVLLDLQGDSAVVAAHASAHPDPVQSIAWSPDGKRFATGAFRRVVIWNAQSLAAEHVFSPGLTDRISALRFLPDGKQLVVADGRIAEEGILRLANSETGAIEKSWVAHADTIFDVAVSTDGKWLATAGGDRLVKVWDLATHELKATLEGHVAQVLTVAFDSSGERLLSGGADQQLKVWDVNTRERIMTLGSHSSAINAAAWGQGAPSVIAATDSGSMFRYTDLKPTSGAQSSSSGSERALESAGSSLYCVAVAGTEERIYAGSHDGRVFIWNKDGKLTAKLNVNDRPLTAATP